MRNVMFSLIMASKYYQSNVVCTHMSYEKCNVYELNN